MGSLPDNKEGRPEGRIQIPPPKQPSMCPHGFHWAALCAWCWYSGKGDNRA